MELKKELLRLQKAWKQEDEDKQNEILESLEDKYHVDLTKFYGEEYNSKKLKQLSKKIKKLM
jgi:hypothetical protein